MKRASDAHCICICPTSHVLAAQISRRRVSPRRRFARERSRAQAERSADVDLASRVSRSMIIRKASTCPRRSADDATIPPAALQRQLGSHRSPKPAEFEAITPCRASRRDKISASRCAAGSLEEALRARQRASTGLAPFGFCRTHSISPSSTSLLALPCCLDLQPLPSLQRTISCPPTECLAASSSRILRCVGDEYDRAHARPFPKPLQNCSSHSTLSA